MRPEAPTFSILMPAFNAAPTLSAAIDSVLAQTYDSWELCLVDDGSTDETLEIAREYERRDDRIRVASVSAGGAAGARNEAARMAHAPYLAFLDSDDMYLPEYLEEMHRFVDENPGHEIYSCGGFYLLPNGLKVRLPGATRRRPFSLSLVDLIRANRILVMAVVDAAAFQRVSGFREGVYVEDYDLWLRMLAAGCRHLQLPRALALYRMTAGSKSGDRTTAVAGTIAVLDDLADRGGLGEPEQRAVAEAVSRLASTREIAQLEERLARGEYARARRDFAKHARGANTWLTRLVGLLLMSVSPRLYRTVLMRRPRPDVSETGE